MLFFVTAEDGRYRVWASALTETPTDPISGFRYVESAFAHDGWLYFAADDRVWSTDGTNLFELASVPAPHVPRFGLVGGKPIFLDPFGRLAMIDDPRTAARTIVNLDGGRTQGSLSIVGSAGDRIMVNAFEQLIASNSSETETLRERVAVEVATAGETTFALMDDGEVLQTDGTRQGTIELGHAANPRFLKASPERIFFLDDDSDGTRLFTYDGGLRAVTGPIVHPYGLAVIDGEAYFAAVERNSYSIWKTDGTSTRLVSEPLPAAPHHLVAAGDRLYVLLIIAGGWLDVWVDGNIVGSVPNTDEPVAVGTRLFVAGDDGLWTSDGTPEGTQMLTTSSSQWPVVHQGALYFMGVDEEGGGELWRSDGTPAGTMRVMDLYPGPRSSYARSYSWGGRLYLIANTPEHGLEILTDSGQPLIETLPGYASLWPRDLYAVGDRLFFIGKTEESGSELWVIDDVKAPPATRPPLDPAESCGCSAVRTGVGSIVTLLFLTLLSVRPRLRR